MKIINSEDLEYTQIAEYLRQIDNYWNQYLPRNQWGSPLWSDPRVPEAAIKLLEQKMWECIKTLAMCSSIIDRIEDDQHDLRGERQVIGVEINWDLIDKVVPTEHIDSVFPNWDMVNFRPYVESEIQKLLPEIIAKAVSMARIDQEVE